MSNINLDIVYNSLVEFLETNTGKSGGLMHPPADQTLPYFIVMPEDERPVDDESMVYDMSDLYFSIKLVGELPEQVLWMKQKVHDVMYDKTKHLTGDDLPPIMWRYCERGGAIVPSGNRLCEANDDYTMRIEYA